MYIIHLFLNIIINEFVKSNIIKFLKPRTDCNKIFKRIFYIDRFLARILNIHKKDHNFNYFFLLIIKKKIIIKIINLIVAMKFQIIIIIILVNFNMYFLKHCYLKNV